MKRVYLCGPMTGLPDFNFPAFHAAAKRLRRIGYDVVNPAEINPDQAMSWEQCLRRDIVEMMTCEGLALLPDWSKSKGAGVEVRLAYDLGFEVATVADLISRAKAARAFDAELNRA